MDEKNSFSTYLSALEAGKQRLENEAKIKQLFIAEFEQKLDLLFHLVSSKQNVLILRGKSGVGKTTILSMLSTKQFDSSDIFLLKATRQHTLEIIQNELVQSVGEIDQQEQSLGYSLEAYAQRDRHVVLLIDNAAQLVAGLTSALVDYAYQYSALQLVFAYAPEEYSAVNNLEDIANKCHFIDLPELNYAQCEKFIRQVICYEKSQYRQKDIDDSLVALIYRKTQGNPRKIIRFIKKEKRDFSNKYFLAIISTVVLVTSFSVVLYFWNENVQEKSVVNEQVSLPISNVVALPASLMQPNHQKDKPQTKPTIKKLPGEERDFPLPIFLEPVALEINGSGQSEVSKVETGGADTIAGKEVTKGNETEVKKTKTIEVKTKEVTKNARVGKEPKYLANTKNIDDRQWVQAQNKKEYTLQLMVLSVKEKLLQEKNKLQEQGYKLFFIEKKISNKKKYVLFLGQFKSYKKAKTKMRLLPKALRNSWPRKFGAIQKDLKNSATGNK